MRGCTCSTRRRSRPAAPSNSCCIQRRNRSRPTRAPSSRKSSSKSGGTLPRCGPHRSMPSPVLDRFLRYVRYDTQSTKTSTTFPSTDKQLILLRALADELRAIGVADASIDEHGYVMATIPATTKKAGVPTIGFIAHVDTSPEMPAPVSRRSCIAVTTDATWCCPTIRPRCCGCTTSPHWPMQIGHDIVTASGTTLLGADNKAGVAEIMTAAGFLVAHPEIAARRPSASAFTPDEEVGRGTQHFDVARFGAQLRLHPRRRPARRDRDRELLGRRDDGHLPRLQHASGLREGPHGERHQGWPRGSSIGCRTTGCRRRRPTATRDSFTPMSSARACETHVGPAADSRFRDRGAAREGSGRSKRSPAEVAAGYPGVRVEVAVDESYRNMKEVLDRHPAVVDHAREAIRRAGIEPIDPSDPRRHRRFTAVVHGTADAQPVRRRAQLSLAARVGLGAGHGKGSRGDRPLGQVWEEQAMRSTSCSARPAPVLALAPMQDVTDCRSGLMARYGGADVYFTEYFRVHATRVWNSACRVPSRRTHRPSGHRADDRQGHSVACAHGGRTRSSCRSRPSI